MSQQDPVERFRIPIAIGLSALLLGGWFWYNETHRPVVQEPVAATVKSEVPAGRPAVPVTAPGISAAGTEAKTAAVTTNVTIRNEQFTFTLRSLGAVVERSVLTDRTGIQHPEPVDFEDGSWEEFRTGSLAFGPDLLTAVEDRVPYRLVRSGATFAEFESAGAGLPEGATVRKRYELSSNGLDLEIRLVRKNAADKAYVLNGNGIGPVLDAHRKTVFDVPTVCAVDGDKYRQELVGDFFKALYTFTFRFSSPPFVRGETPTEWVALHNRFYFRALVPAAKLTPVFVNQTQNGETRPVAGVELPAGADVTQKMKFYFFPKSRNLLKKQYDATGIQFFQIFDQWSITSLISGFFYYAMLWTNDLLKNFGLTLVVLTILLKLVTWPLNQSSLNAMTKMGQLAPRVQEIQNRYKNDSTRANQEVMELYRKEKVNPLGGCLPILIQIPVFISLYSLFRNMVEVDHVRFLWIPDLGLPDTVWRTELPLVGHFNFNLLPILMTGSQMLQSYLTPSTPGQSGQQAVILKYLLPLFFLTLLWNMPSALTLYWTTQNVVAVIQTLLSRRTAPAGTSATAKKKKA